MRVVHRGAETRGVLANDVRFADSFLAKSFGLMGRRPLDDGEALVFRFDAPDVRDVHTMFVRATIDVIWIERERVMEVETMPPWRFGTSASADTIVELPEGAAADVREGDIIRLAADEEDN